MTGSSQPLVGSDVRFLILPGVSVPTLASRVPGLCPVLLAPVGSDEPFRPA
jgi:hypothetical protein